MRRRLFNLAAVASLPLCVAACGMWLRSYYAFDTAYITAGGRSLALGTPAGRLWLVFDSQVPLYKIGPEPKPVPNIDALATGWTGARQSAGFTWIFTKDLTAMLVPFWALTLVTLVVPTLWLWRRFRSRRAGAAGFPVGEAKPGEASPGQ